jgi:hypothetical protein
MGSATQSLGYPSFTKAIFVAAADPRGFNGAEVAL